MMLPPEIDALACRLGSGDLADDELERVYAYCTCRSDLSIPEDDGGDPLCPVHGAA